MTFIIDTDPADEVACVLGVVKEMENRVAQEKFAHSLVALRGFVEGLEAALDRWRTMPSITNFPRVIEAEIARRRDLLRKIGA